MRIKSLNTFLALSLSTLMACSQNKESQPEVATTSEKKQTITDKVVPHDYGGWYCPDNLNGFPAVDLANWNTVPVISDRLPTEAEAKSEASLIYVDTEKHPDATTFDLKLPQLATFQSPYTDREEVIIVIQAVKVGNDSIVGFRYLNGGNGSARVNEVNLVSEQKVGLNSSAQFVSQSKYINAKPEKIWEKLTKPDYADSFQSIFSSNKSLKPDWRSKTNINFTYPAAGNLTSQYANILYGNYYAQNDYDSNNYSEKFMLIENKESQLTELKIVCGPFADDYEKQKQLISTWANEMKALSEKD